MTFGLTRFECTIFFIDNYTKDACACVYVYVYMYVCVCVKEYVTQKTIDIPILIHFSSTFIYYKFPFASDCILLV